MNTIKDIRQQLVDLNKTTPEGEMVEILGASFIADEDYIIRKPNQAYVDAELAWYYTMDRRVSTLTKIYGKEVPIWERIKCDEGFINSNYGWCLFSKDNHEQHQAVVEELLGNPNSRRASAIYTRPTMHKDAVANGRDDFCCTHAVDYNMRNGKLNAIIHMRSNDAWRGASNDIPWQRHILTRLAEELDYEVGDLFWSASSLHVYPQDRKILEDLL